MSDPVIIRFDGASKGNPGPASCGYEISSIGLSVRKGVKLDIMTNNEAEYQGLIYALLDLQLASFLETRFGDRPPIFIEGDSKLVVEQLSGRWKVKARNLRPSFEHAARLVRDLGATIRWVPRERNAVADRLANEALLRVD